MEARPKVVFWAQRKVQVFICFNIENMIANTWSIRVTPEGAIHFKVNTSDAGEIRVDLDLHDRVVPNDSKWKIEGRHVMLSLPKENKNAAYWPRFLKEDQPFVRREQGLWCDEDEEEMMGYPDFDATFVNIYNEPGVSDHEEKKHINPEDLD